MTPGILKLVRAFTGMILTAIQLAHSYSSEPTILSSLHEVNGMVPSLVPVPYNYMPSSSTTAQESKQSKISR